MEPYDVFSPECTRDRRNRLFEAAKPRPDIVLAGVLRDGPARLYLTGAHEGIAAVTQEGCSLVAHVMLAEAAARSGWPVFEFRTARQREAALRKAVGTNRRIGIPWNQLTSAERRRWREVLPDRRWTDSTRALSALASRKDDAEIALLRRMAGAIDAVMARVPGWLREGLREHELKSRIECALLRKGAAGLTFGALASFGENTSLPHALTGHRRLRKGDLVMVDAGGALFGYGSDMTRTFAFGKAPARLRRVYRAVHDAHGLAYELFAAGKTLRQVNRAIDRRFRAAGFGPFIHSVGHTLGPVPSEVRNEPGAVFTIEPGLYLRGVGGVRIEDDVLITPDGLENLTPYTHALVEVA